MERGIQMTFKGKAALHDLEWILNDLFDGNLHEVSNNDVEDIHGYVKFEEKKCMCIYNSTVNLQKMFCVKFLW